METDKNINEVTFKESFEAYHLKNFLSDDVIYSADAFSDLITLDELPEIFTQLVDAVFDAKERGFSGKYIQFKYDGYERKVLLSTIFDVNKIRYSSNNLYTYVTHQSREIVYDIDPFAVDSFTRKIDVFANLAVTMSLFFEQGIEDVERGARNLLNHLSDDFYAKHYIFRRLKERDWPLVYLSYGVLME